jgi:hypothetical protein
MTQPIRSKSKSKGIKVTLSNGVALWYLIVRTLSRNLTSFIARTLLTLILLTWTKWRAPTNASKWRMGFNSAFKGLTRSSICFCWSRFHRRWKMCVSRSWFLLAVASWVKMIINACTSMCCQTLHTFGKSLE